jgi:hypothetical protein
MDPNKTQDWIDLYSLILDSLAEFLADPKKRALKMGITEAELKDQMNTMRLPGKMDLEKYRESCEAWRSVARQLKSFGVTLDEELQLAPTMDQMKGSWLSDPYLHVFHLGETKPLTFRGRECMTAIGFFSFYANQCDKLDPTKKIRASLEAQGITKENFAERMALTGIANPWEADKPLPESPVPVELPPQSRIIRPS